MRLDKLLSHAGLGSRKDVRKIIISGEISVNDEKVTKAGFNVNPETDTVKYLNIVVNYKEFYYVMLNKPEGIISATEDRQYETVVDWVELDYKHVDLFPVGRLDIDTTGLLLLTNNGQLAHQLLSPKKKVRKKYEALIDGIVTKSDVEKFKQGLDLGDFISQPAKLEILSIDQELAQSHIHVVITEGKFHQVKRMFEAVDKKVIQLKRLEMGPLKLDPNLEIGDYRELNQDELNLLKPYGL
ncbi:pseudouridine synthase [Aerococcaceae bacterium WGS1372]